MLGTDLTLALSGRDVTALGRADLDIADAAAVHDAVANHDVVINTAAYTRVDDAESHEPEARLVNAVGAGLLAAAALRHGARLVHISTDYVFDGTATVPYEEDAVRNPVSAYGRTKAEGEELVLAAHPEGAIIVRTAWLYGTHGKNFPRTVLGLAATNETIDVVDDQRGQPTSTADLAERIVALLDSGINAGVFHGTNAGEATWYSFARAAFSLAGLDPDRIRPTVSTNFIRPAPRPSYSVLGNRAWNEVGLPPMRPWEQSLEAAMDSGFLA